jgi:uncharacterized glyoxalase superfamily protein PhnB
MTCTLLARTRRPDFLQEVEIAPWDAKHISLKDPFGTCWASIKT